MAMYRSLKVNIDDCDGFYGGFRRFPNIFQYAEHGIMRVKAYLLRYKRCFSGFLRDFCESATLLYSF